MAIDPEYRRLSRARHQTAATKTRLMRVIEDPRSGTVARNLAPIQIQIGKRKACPGAGYSRAQPRVCRAVQCAGPAQGFCNGAECKLRHARSFVP